MKIQLATLLSGCAVNSLFDNLMRSKFTYHTIINLDIENAIERKYEGGIYHSFNIIKLKK